MPYKYTEAARANKARYYRENIDKIKAVARKRYLAKTDLIKQQVKAYTKKNKARLKNATLKRMYGIDMDQFKQMYVAQSGQCAICSYRFQKSKEIKIDHNHTTGRVRQLLCDKCNAGIGMLQEDISILLKAIEYLKRWNN